MTFSPPNTLEPALPENINFAENYEQFLEQWTNLYRKLAIKVNGKERAIYPLGLEILNDQSFFTAGDPRTFRSVFRRVYNFGALAAGGVLNIPHGIAAFTAFTRIYGTCITNVVDYRPIPYVSVAAANQGIQVEIAGINIVISNGGAAAPITSGLIVLEFLKN